MKVNAPTIPDGANLSSPDPYGYDLQPTQPENLRVTGSGAAVKSQDGQVQVWSGSPSSLSPTNPVTQGTLVRSSNGAQYTETDPDGTQWIFAGNWASGFAPGKLEEMIPPGGSGSVCYSYTSSGWSTATQVGSAAWESATYTMNSAGQTVAESVSAAQGPVSSASLTYYTSGQSGGSPGDLELIQAYGPGGTSAGVVNATFYRYYEGSYSSGGSTGYNASYNPGRPDELEFIVSGAALGRMMQAAGVGYGGLTSVSGATVASYADDFYKYMSTGLVEEIDAAGGACSNCGGEAPRPTSTPQATPRPEPITGAPKRPSSAPTAAPSRPSTITWAKQSCKTPPSP